MTPEYPQLRLHLRAGVEQLSQQMPEVMRSVNALHAAAYKEGALSTKHKELMALGIAISVHCEGCIAFHVYEALRHGATSDEIFECIGVAVQMGGGPSAVYGTYAWDALRQFQELSPGEGN